MCSFIISRCSERKHTSSSTEKNGITEELLRKKLIGKWGSDNIAVFEIKADSIYYMQKDSTYPYQLKGDTFMVRFSPNEIFSIWGKLKVIGDTLQIIDFKSNNFITYGYRVR